MLISHPAPAQLDAGIPIDAASSYATATTLRAYYDDVAGLALAAAVGNIAAVNSFVDRLRNKSEPDGRGSGHSESDYDDADIDPASDYVPPEQRPETYIITVLFALIFIVGVLGNGTLVIIFFRHRSMRNIPNTYILSLALADLLVIIICVPLACIVYTQESWTFGAQMCRISECFKDISIGVSVFTLTALSGERYCAIVNPLRKLQTKPLTVFTATMIWLLAILLATPSFVVSDIQEIHLPPGGHNENLTIIVYCSPFGRNRTNLESYTRYTVISKAFVYYLLPLFIIGALYILMAKRLHTSAREMPGEALGMQTRSQARARRHVARMVVAFVVVFFVCFFPYHLFELWFHLNPTAKEDFDGFWHAIRIIGFCASFLHSCVNPVALYCVSGVFRQHFNRYLCCLCIKRQPRIRQHSTATGLMDTSIMSMRRSTLSNYNRASLHIHNNNSNMMHSRSGVNSSGVGSGGSTNFHRQTSIPLQHSVAKQRNGSGGVVGAASGSDQR
ncbi:PREDICTED: neuropeptide CCHamide-2 receptor-like [Rhagoletis zephyria]|uniref:neuropeptide CCHamide-2 receptor-like n=1 Tax=Rhagoletis zephyria TaxID=28612 RepID=UPI000811A155|nr:PREDICTED: neuropeptide CCHamide-2 receptor-like [Rhagoletis zephyria]